MFVLTIQSALDPLLKRAPFLNNFLSMSYEKYQHDNDIKVFNCIEKLYRACFKLVSPKEQAIILVDPQKRLESMFHMIFKNSDSSTNKLESKLKSQLLSMDTKVCNSNRTLQDNITENFRNIITNVECLKQENETDRKLMHTKLSKIEVQLGDSIQAFCRETNDYHVKTRFSFDDRIVNIENKLIENEKKLKGEFEILNTKIDSLSKDLEKNFHKKYPANCE